LTQRPSCWLFGIVKAGLHLPMARFAGLDRPRKGIAGSFQLSSSRSNDDAENEASGRNWPIGDTDRRASAIQAMECSVAYN
jgi:hypothetical protein